MLLMLAEVMLNITYITLNPEHCFLFTRTLLLVLCFQGDNCPEFDVCMEWFYFSYLDMSRRYASVFIKRSQMMVVEERKGLPDKRR